MPSHPAPPTFALALALALGSAAIAATAHAASGGGDKSKPTSPAEARAFVNAHNAVRAAVQMPAGYVGPWVPIPPVAWSDEVASSAQAWADHLHDDMKCGLMHDDTRYGENLAGGKKIDAEDAVRMWAGEGSKYRYSPKYDFEPKTGHYTQLVWRKTTHIGCARVSCGRNTVVVCRYSPAGNHIGKAPY
jgi:pathogenesis-related protein 1